jgi:pyruvate dehydrogenase E1 component alpha subunit
MTKKELIEFEKQIAERFDNGEIPYLTHLSGGNEDVLIEIFKLIGEGDYVFSTHRSHYHYLLHGGSPNDLEQKILNGKSMFVFNRSLNFFALSIVAAAPSIAAGVAWALKRKGSRQKVWCFIGDGAEEEGHFYEAVRYVEGWNLPCMFIVENNDRSVSSCCKERRGNCNWEWNQACVKYYHYTSTYPHGGSGTNKWLEFKKEAKVVERPKRMSSKINTHLPIPKTEIPYLVPMERPMTYFEAVKESMETLATNFHTIFIGYNVKHGSAYGSLKDIPEVQKLETPLAENLMMGLAMGMSLEGYRPVVFFERHDFILNGIDAIVNTLDIIDVISEGEFTMPVVIKAVVGGVKPFYAGLTHTNDLSGAIRRMVSFPVYSPQNAKEVKEAYRVAKLAQHPVMISERKELY